MEEQKRELTFLSYAHDDLKKVREVYEGLKKRKVSVWFDKEDITTGKWYPQIMRQISLSKYFIFCVSEASIKKTSGDKPGFADKELQRAYEIAMIQPDDVFTIVPVRLEECESGNDLRISSFQQYDLFPDMVKSLDKLAVNIGGISLVDAKAKDERTEDEKLIDSLFGKADIAYYAGEYNKALNMYETVINIDSVNSRAWHNKGNALNALGKQEAAISAFDKSIEIKPNDQDAYYNKGTTLLQSGKLKQAIFAYDKAIALKPDFHEAWHNKGNALIALDKHKAAITAYEKAIEIKPDSHSSWHHKELALLQAKLVESEEAISSYDKAIEIKPDKHKAYNNKGFALEKLGRTKEAKKAFKKAKQLKKKL